MENLTKLTLCRQTELLQSGEIRASELTEAYLKNIEQTEDKIGAYITLTAGQAIEKAAEIDRRRAAGEKLSPLAGIPAAIKDNICTRGIKTTCASKMLENFTPPYDATVVQKLADTVLLGKVNMDEFAMGSSTENSAMKITRNPHDTSRVPGGSSGGSAAAVAAGEAAFAIGSDTGGSVRQPAAFCGVVGAKPTYGSVSRYGLIAFASSLDQIGPLTKTVRDSALVLDAISGYDEMDSTSAMRAYESCAKDISKGAKGLKIALPRQFFSAKDSEVQKALLHAVELLKDAGAEFKEISMPALDFALPAYYVISGAEASSNLARFDGVRYGRRAASFEDISDLDVQSRSEGFGEEVKRRIMLGTFVLSAGYYDAYYKKAQQVRGLIIQQFEEALSGCDCIFGPVAPGTAYKIGEKSADPLEMYRGDIYTVPVNIAGLPAISLPCGRGEGNLPIGAQFIGRRFDEATIYRAAAALEDAAGTADKILAGEGAQL